MAKAKKRKKKAEETTPEEPPMTSMIDIVFQLLIFFILTLQIKSVEGKLINQLPKDKGLASSSSSSPEEQEVRIILCCIDDSAADYVREVNRHQNNKGKHEASLEAEEKANITDTKSRRHPGHIVVNDVCTAWVAKNPVGTLYKSWVCGKEHLEDTSLGAAKRVAENVKRYEAIASKAKELYDATPSSRDPKKRAPVILDMDSAVPYEHIIGVINALKALGIHNIEFVGNSRHSRYYGSGQKGQFDTYRDQVK
jgi:biopolymer transport protein ExbD